MVLVERNQPKGVKPKSRERILIICKLTRGVIVKRRKIRVGCVYLYIQGGSNMTGTICV